MTRPTFGEWIADKQREHHLDRNGDPIPAFEGSALAPVELIVKRYKCPTCRKSWSKRARAVEHAAKCWYNPANKTCKTCTHFEIEKDEPEVGFEGFLYCNAKEAELAYEIVPVVACPLWEAVSVR